MEYCLSDYISNHLSSPGEGKPISSVINPIMQRESVEPLFNKQKRPASLLPSVMVLPKISNEQNGSLDQASITRNFSENNRSSKMATTSMTSPPPDDDVDIQNDLSTKATRSQNQVRKRSGSNSNGKTASPNSPASTNNFYPSLPPTYRLADSLESKYSQDKTKKNVKLIKKRLPADQRHDFDSSFKAFEDLTRRELWHYSKPASHPAVSRRASICSSCGGAMSSAYSTSTRRFSTVSIELGSENPMKNINDSVLPIDVGAVANGNSPLHPMTLDDRQMSSNSKNNGESNVELKTYQRIEKERNLLYDLISVLYRKNFIKDEVGPYVRYALEICGEDGS